MINYAKESSVFDYGVPRFIPKDPISALTHFIGFVASIFGMPVLLVEAARSQKGVGALISLSIFMMSMILLYGASAAYHSFNLTVRTNRILKKLDHMMIFLLIAGSYTPICVIVLDKASGLPLLALVWGIAAAGMALKACWVTCPKWFSSIIYIGMGWVCILAFSDIYRALPLTGFLWLLAGGIFYTVGGVVYALKLRILERRFTGFGAHELFHIFVMCGSLCHYIVMLGLVAP